MDQRWAAFCAEATWIWHQDQYGFGAIKIGDEFNGKTERDCILAEFDNVVHFR